MRGKGSRELPLTVLLVLAGSLLLLVSAGRPWVRLVLAQAPPLPPRSDVRTGAELAGALRPLALLGLSGIAALAATRGRGRIPVGAVLLAAGAAAGLAAGTRLGEGAAAAFGSGGGAARFTGWPVAALLGAVLLATGGVVVAVRGPRWSALSARHELAEGTARRRGSAPEVSAWEALDRGEDPTRHDPVADGVHDPS